MSVPIGIKLEVALGSGPGDYAPGGDLTSGTWTDLTSRMLSFELSGGRQDQTGQFEPTTITVELDSSDRMLDPIFPGSLTEFAAGKGRPLCPVRVSTVVNGVTRRRFTGHLGPECWPVERATVGASATVRLEAFDRLAYFDQLDLPSSSFATLATLLRPDWWARSLGGDLLVGDGGVVKDYSGNGHLTKVTAPGSAVAYSVESMVRGDTDPAFMVPAAVGITSASSPLEAATNDMTYLVIWQGAPHGSDQLIARQQVFFGATRWDLRCSPSGQIIATVRTDAGVVDTYVAAPANPTAGSGGRWDDGKPHLVGLRVVGGGTLRIFADGMTGSVATTVPSVRGLLVTGTGPITQRFDEPMFWQKSLSIAEVNYLTTEFLGTAGPFNGDSLGIRVGRWFDVAGITRDGFNNFDLHAAGSPALRGLSTSPATFGSALRETADSYLGAVWARRNGRIRVRTALALTRSEYAADYQTPIAHLTDEVTPAGSPPAVRRSPLRWSGIRPDRVVNVSAAAVKTSLGELTAQWRDDLSVVRYGTRRRDWSTDVSDFLEASLIAKADVTRWAEPQPEIEAVRIGPVFTLAEAVFLATYELENAVTITDTPAVGSPWTGTMQIQGERWSWSDGTHLSVELSLAKS